MLARDYLMIWELSNKSTYTFEISLKDPTKTWHYSMYYCLKHADSDKLRWGNQLSSVLVVIWNRKSGQNMSKVIDSNNSGAILWHIVYHSSLHQFLLRHTGCSFDYIIIFGISKCESKWQCFIHERISQSPFAPPITQSSNPSYPHLKI